MATELGSRAKLRAALVGIGGVALLLLHLQLETYHAQNLALKLGIEIVKEIGFALIVSVVIWVTFEYFSSSEREAEWSHRISAITDNVFHAVLQKKLPPELIEAISASVLNQVLYARDLT